MIGRTSSWADVHRVLLLDSLLGTGPARDPLDHSSPPDDDGHHPLPTTSILDSGDLAVRCRRHTVILE